MISIIGTPKSARMRLSWRILKDAVAHSPNINTRKMTEYEFMTSGEIKNYFRQVPKTGEEWERLVESLKNLIFLNGLKKRDADLVTMFLTKYFNGVDVSDFFPKRNSVVADRLMSYAKNSFTFEEENKHNEEIF